MDWSISRLCLLLVCGFAPGMQSGLGALELDAREEPCDPFGVTRRAPDVNATAGTFWWARPGSGQDDAVRRAGSLLPDVPAADNSSDHPRVFYVPAGADSPARSLFGPPLPEPLFRPIPTSWSADVFMPIPTTCDAEIILVDDSLGMRAPLRSAWPRTQPERGSKTVGRVAW